MGRTPAQDARRESSSGQILLVMTANPRVNAHQACTCDAEQTVASFAMVMRVVAAPLRALNARVGRLTSQTATRVSAAPKMSISTSSGTSAVAAASIMTVRLVSLEPLFPDLELPLRAIFFASA